MHSPQGIYRPQSSEITAAPMLLQQNKTDQKEKENSTGWCKTGVSSFLVMSGQCQTDSLVYMFH